MPEELATISNGESLSPADAGSDEAWSFPSRLEDFTKLFSDTRSDNAADITPGSRVPPVESAAEENSGPANPNGDEPRTFGDLFRRLRMDTRGRPPAGSDYKQFITHVADRVRIDWEGLLHGRTWQDLTPTAIEDAIVLSLFQKACTRLTGADRAKLAADLGEAAGAPEILADLLGSGAIILAKLTGPQIHLMRDAKWELCRTGSTGSLHELSANTKSAILGNVEITGSIAFRGELVFDGKLKSGSIIGDILQVGKNAKIKGDVLVDTLNLSGKITGNTTATEKCALEPTAEIIGTLTAHRLAMAEGATLVGEVRLGPASENHNPE